MKRLLLPLLVIVLVLAVAGPAVAKNTEPVVAGGCRTEVSADHFRFFAFNARGTFADAEGTVLYRRTGSVPAGWWHWAQFEVRHLIVVENRVLLAAVITRHEKVDDYTGDPEWVLFLLEDNGEGPATAPDRALAMTYHNEVLPSEAQLISVYLGDSSGWPEVIQGNIQIR